MSLIFCTSTSFAATGRRLVFPHLILRTAPSALAWVCCSFCPGKLNQLKRRKPPRKAQATPMRRHRIRVFEAPQFSQTLMPTRRESINVPRSLPGERLDTYLRSQFPALSRGAIQRLIEQGHIRVNGQSTKPTHHPRAGEQIEIEWPEARPSKVRPEEMPLDILFEDDDLVVLNKPPGLVVHPAAGHEEHTLVNALLHHCAGQLSGIGGVARPGIVHRLDKATSGCLVVAKNDPTHLTLSAQFACRQVEKVYHAIVCGEMERDTGEI